jgi:hypothetical protein
MATTDLTLLQIQELSQALAVMQQSLDQLKLQHGLLIDAFVNVVEGRWDAAQFGNRSVEADVVSMNPALQGKLQPIPFVHGR